MKITRFRIASLHNEEWFSFHSEYLEMLPDHILQLPVVGLLVSPYKKLYREAGLLLELLNKSLITADSTAANRDRRLAFRGLRDAVKSYLHLQSPAHQEAARKVRDVIRKYSDTIQKGSLAGKTAAIDNLLQDLMQDGGGGINLTAEVRLLAIHPWVEALDAANMAYKESADRRNKEDASRPEAGRLPRVRAQADHYYVNMTCVIDAILLAGGCQSSGAEGNEGEEDPGNGPVEDRQDAAFIPFEEIQHFARQLNVCAAYYKALLKGRRTRSGKKQN